MEKFVVWDEDSEMFIDETKCILVNGTLFRNEKDFANEISDDLSMFFSIGLIDMNEKSIYADSSIVEFDYKYLSGLVEKTVGCFIFDKKELIYKIKFVGTPSENCIDYSKSSMSNFEIIDTIQENKLGLIKA